MKSGMDEFVRFSGHRNNSCWLAFIDEEDLLHYE
jgi:hypothetical protein